MNDSRKKVEAFKKTPNSEEMGKVKINMKFPANYHNLDLNAKNKADNLALDEAIAAHLGVAINDHETWPEEQGKIFAYEWAAMLPDA